MSDELSCPVEFPPVPDGRVLPPKTPRFEKEEEETVTIHGYIGEVEGDHIRLHHAFDHRAYFRIPIEGIARSELDAASGLKNLYRLTIYSTTPIRYYEATTVDLTASVLNQALNRWNQENPRTVQPLGAPPKCPANCPARCCRNGQCICRPGSITAQEVLDQFGLVVSTPVFGGRLRRPERPLNPTRG